MIRISAILRGSLLLVAVVNSIELARGAVNSSVQVDVSADYHMPGDPPVTESGTKIVDAASYASETVTAHSNFASATASVSGGFGTLSANTFAELTTATGSRSYAGASASTNLYADGATYAITGVWAVSGGGNVRLGPANLNANGSAGTINPNSWNIPSGTSLNLRASSGSGNDTWPPTAFGSASVVFVTHLANESAPPLPGSDDDDPNQLRRGGGIDLDDLRGDDSGLSGETTSPANIAGINLTAVVGSHGRLNPVYVGPPENNERVGTNQAINLVTGYRYSVAENLFTHFTLPAAFPGDDSTLQVEVDGNIVPYTPGTLFDFTQYVPGGVAEFYLSGIDATEDFRLNEVAPFVSGMRFVNDGLADITIAPSDLSPIIVGDFNSDEVVDAADYVVWRKLEGGTLLSGEVYTPGIADEADYNGWAENHGAHRFIPPGAGAATPEPSGLLMVMLAAYVAISISRTRQASFVSCQSS